MSEVDTAALLAPLQDAAPVETDEQRAARAADTPELKAQRLLLATQGSDHVAAIHALLAEATDAIGTIRNALANGGSGFAAEFEHAVEALQAAQARAQG